jgi:Zn-finger nucleic acid-binding protein
MRSYERSGITIDQCTECRGVFLDRGELERLIDAEAASLSDTAPSKTTRPDRPDTAEKGRRRKGFLGDLFELGG